MVFFFYSQGASCIYFNCTNIHILRKYSKLAWAALYGTVAIIIGNC